MTDGLTRRSFLSAAAALTAGSTLAACGGGSGAGGNSALTDKMGRNSTTNVTHIPLIVAQKKGYFKDAKLSYDSVGLGSSNLPTALLTKQIDSAYLGVAGTFMVLKAKGKDLVCVGETTANNPNAFVVSQKFIDDVGVGPDAPLMDRINAITKARFAATDPGSGTEVTIKAVASTATDAPDKLDITYLHDIGTFLGAMKQNNVDAFSVFSPIPEQAEAQGIGVRYISLADSGLTQFDEMAWTSVWMRRDVASSNRDRTEAIMAGISKALAFINSDPASAREVVRPAFGNLSDDIFNAVWKNNLAIFPGSPEMSSDGVDKAIVLNNISAETPYNGSPREVFTNRYL